MAIGDFLSSVGQGLEKGAQATGRVAGALAPAIGKAVVNEEAGYSPQIAAEQRSHNQQMEDQALAAREQELTNQLNIGRQYGTLNPQQQQQYVDAITQLYSHPRHAGTLMEKLRQAVSPNGMTAGAQQAAPAALANAVPAGGTAAADERAKEEAAQKAADLKEQNAESLAEKRAELANKYRKPAGKSPALSGSQLPPDALGPNGQPIPPEQRGATSSFIQYAGEWWPVQKKPPVVSVVNGHRVLLDADTKQRIPGGDLGPVAGVKVTDTGTWTPNGDPTNPQMVWVPRHTVTGPGGAEIEVQLSPEEQAAEGGKGAAQTSPQSAPKTPTAPAGGTAQPPKRVAQALTSPTTGARPITHHAPAQLRNLPGGSMMAASKSPLYKSDTSQYTKVAEEANSKQEAYQSALKALSGTPTPSSDQELIYSWVRANVTGAGRMTQAEFMQAGRIGGLPQHVQNAFTQTLTGRLPTNMEQMLLADIKRSADTSQQEADTLRKRLTTPQGSIAGGDGTTRQVGETKKFPNGKTGVWDGQGWVAQ